MKTYEVVCFSCYTCIVGKTTSKREADRMAVSHMNAYGHQTAVQTKIPTAKERTNG